MDYSTNPVNRALKRLMEKHKLSDAEAHRQLGLYTPAAIGNYRRGVREVPTDFIQKWEKVFGEKLLEEAKEVKMTVDTNVSHETKAPPTLELWEELQRNNRQLHKTRSEDYQEKSKLLEQNGKLIEQNGKLIDIFHDLTRRGVIPHKS